MLDIVLATSADLPGLDEDSVPLLEALRSRGLSCEPRVWDSGFDPGEARLCLLRSTWDYDLRHEEFLAWARETDARVALLPSLATVTWNTDKRYLLDLEALGADVVPTAWLTPGASLADVMDERRWERAVVKPTVGAGARGLITVRRAEAAARQEAADALLATGPALMQPFLESVQTEGELSLLFAEGELTHAVRKRPQSGDFRVQPEYGGSVALEEPGAAAVDAATRTIDTFTTPPLIARVDLVAGDGDTPLLIELELVEPCLFLRHAPAATERYADAVARRLEALT